MIKTTEKNMEKSTERYFEAVGRRKTSVARIRLFAAKGKGEGFDILVNEKPYKIYFPLLALQKIVEAALVAADKVGAYRITIKANGGGIHSQSEAVRHGIARALLKVDPDYRKRLKVLGYLKRDPRMKERRKFGLKKARKSPQWAKR